MHHPLGNYAGSDNAKGEPAAEMAAAAGVVVPAEFEIRREVRMSRPGMLTEILIVL